MLVEKRCGVYPVPKTPFTEAWWYSLAKILQQVKDSDNPIPLEFLAQAPPKEPSNDAVTKFVLAYTSHTRIGTLTKEKSTGKLVKEWEVALEAANSKPEQAEMGPALSSMMAVKDDEELVDISNSRYVSIWLSSQITETYPNSCKSHLHAAHSLHRSETRNHPG